MHCSYWHLRSLKTSIAPLSLWGHWYSAADGGFVQVFSTGAGAAAGVTGRLPSQLFEGHTNQCKLHASYCTITHLSCYSTIHLHFFYQNGGVVSKWLWATCRSDDRISGGQCWPAREHKQSTQSRGRTCYKEVLGSCSMSWRTSHACRNENGRTLTREWWKREDNETRRANISALQGTKKEDTLKSGGQALRRRPVQGCEDQEDIGESQRTPRGHSRVSEDKKGLWNRPRGHLEDNVPSPSPSPSPSLA